MWTTAQKIKTHYQQIGQGKSLVFLHGWGCDWQIWSPIITELSKIYELTLLDLPGFGQSENPPTTWNSTNYSWLLKEIFKELQLEKSVLIGHSFGGKISSIFAAQFPQLITKLMLVDSAGLP